MADLRRRTGNHFTERGIRRQQPHADQARKHRFGKIDQRDKRRRPAAVIAQIVRQTGVSAALAAHILAQKHMRNKDGPVQASEQIACRNAGCNSPSHVSPPYPPSAGL